MANDDPLKYRFRAEYEDGEVFEQNADDVSAVDPLKSAFFDVDHARLRTFSLWGPDAACLVDLRDGHFELSVNGSGAFPFIIHEPREVVGPFRLFFFRRQRAHLKTNYRVGEDGQYHQDGPSFDGGREVTFRLGWEAQTPEGNPVSRIMEFV